MMTGNVSTGHQRSYERNLVWCRFWLTIGIAVATLSFTFMADQGFRPLIDSSPEGTEQLERAPGAPVSDEADGMTMSSPEERIKWLDILIFAFLIFTAGACILVSYRFRLLYIRADSTLEKIARDDSQEARP